MEREKSHKIEIWAQLLLCDEDSELVRRFLQTFLGVRLAAIPHVLHLTLYHARRPLPGACQVLEPARVVIPVVDTRFMVMAPGGENPRPELDPGKARVGIRVQRQSAAYPQILDFRRRLTALETPKILGTRSPSTGKASAFGARHYQPHMTLLRPGTGIARDLHPIGQAFREALGDLHFDRFFVDVARADSHPGREPVQ